MVKAGGRRDTEGDYFEHACAQLRSTRSTAAQSRQGPVSGSASRFEYENPGAVLRGDEPGCRQKDRKSASEQTCGEVEDSQHRPGADHDQQNRDPIMKTNRARRAMTVSAVSRSLLQLRRDERGVTAVIITLTLPVLFAFGALVINSGLWFTIKRQNQSAADAAAISAAYEVMAGNTDVTNNLIPAATEAAGPTQNGYVGSALTACTTGGTCCLESTPLSEVCYPYNDSLLDTEFGALKYQAVAVTLVQSQDSLFAFAPLTSATIATKAVGVIKVLDNPCMLALGRTGTGVEVQGSSSVTMPGCSIVANSTDAAAIDIHDNGGSITADTLVTPGQVAFKGNPVSPPLPSAFTLTSPPKTFAPAVSDPYASKLTHSFDIAGLPPSSPPCIKTGSTWQGGCTIPSASIKVGDTLSAGTQISGGLSFSGGTVNLSPGTYWITDCDLQLGPGATLQCPTCTGGAGVTIILTGTGKIGGFCSDANSSVTLNAPTSDPTYKGYLIIQDPGATTGTSSCKKADNSFQGGASMNLTGLLYFPNTTVVYQGNPSSACSVLVAKTIALNGNSNFSTLGCTGAGLGAPTVKTIVLGE
jgi:Putative Flp pilus-assembly TadE/G-like